MCRNVKEKSYLCNRTHIRHSSFSTILTKATCELLEEGLLPVHTYGGVGFGGTFSNMVG